MHSQRALPCICNACHGWLIFVMQFQDIRTFQSLCYYGQPCTGGPGNIDEGPQVPSCHFRPHECLLLHYTSIWFDGVTSCCVRVCVVFLDAVAASRWYSSGRRRRFGLLASRYARRCDDNAVLIISHVLYMHLFPTLFPCSLLFSFHTSYLEVLKLLWIVSGSLPKLWQIDSCCWWCCVGIRRLQKSKNELRG